MSDRLGRRAFLTGVVASGALAACSDSRTIRPNLAKLDSGETPLESEEADTDLPPITDTGSDTGSVEPTLFDPSEFHEDLARFPLAVQAGAVRATSAVFAVYVEGGPAVTLALWERDTGILIHESLQQPDSNGYLKVSVDGLSASRHYRYCYMYEGGRSIVGSVRTALGVDQTGPLTFALGACTHPLQAPFPALQRTSTYDLDFFIHLGDMSYNDFALNLEQYRQNWKNTLSEDGYHRIFANCGAYMTWDDHEFANDFNPEVMPESRISAAKQSYFECHAIEVAEDEHIWNAYRWGLTAEIIVLDSRSERKPSTRDSDDPVYLSRAQMDWLKATLSSSPCRFKVIVNSVPIATMPGLFALATSDRWEGYAAQREELLSHIKSSEIEGVLFVSGDFHVCFIGRIDPDGDLWEVAMTSGNGSILGDYLEDDQFIYGTSKAHVTLVTLDPEALTVTIEFVDPDTGVTSAYKTLSL